ncbi:eukaryotic rRNA processing [Jimgerdemannia flammicorona]|uniref:Eukaryotic rRNA processing n=1 Tax=Jimgerdemannia flammicorona TaxID=994334 RepID=A0A433D2G1_9FUNG|nr:eukaryotic rRNA processing [Jimgerdemannia flammicorona]
MLDDDEAFSEEEVQEEDVALEDLDESDIEGEDEDLVTEQRITVNNQPALIRIYNDFKLKSLPWIETMTVTSAEPLVLKDVHNDLERELAFYQQALSAAKEGREKTKAAGVQFSRPDDYFAEMVKSDEHMEKVRQRLLDETASIKAAEEARRQRDLKKFGKKVQVEKLQARQKQKADELEKIKLMKRKRKGADDMTGGEDEFDISLDDGDDSKRGSKRAKGGKDAKGNASYRDGKNFNRARKDSKYGFGGKKRFAKSNTAESAADISDFNPRKNKGGFNKWSENSQSSQREKQARQSETPGIKG